MDSDRKIQQGNLRMIEWQVEPVDVTPLPETWESDTEFAWLEFDAAVAALDLTTLAGRTEYEILRAARES